MEQAEFGEERSSISDPLDPDDETLIWSAGNFLDPSLTVKILETDTNHFDSEKFGSKKGYCVARKVFTEFYDINVDLILMIHLFENLS